MNVKDPFSGRVRIRSCALVTNNEKLLLVKQRVPTRAEPIWLPPGGEIEFGERAADAAEREVAEETGLRIQCGPLSAIHEFTEPPYHAIEFFFLATLIGGELMTGTDPELSAKNQQILTCRFLDFDELKNRSVYPEFLKENLWKILDKDVPVLHVGKEAKN